MSTRLPDTTAPDRTPAIRRRAGSESARRDRRIDGPGESHSTEDQLTGRHKGSRTNTGRRKVGRHCRGRAAGARGVDGDVAGQRVAARGVGDGGGLEEALVEVLSQLDRLFRTLLRSVSPECQRHRLLRPTLRRI